MTPQKMSHRARLYEVAAQNDLVAALRKSMLTALGRIPLQGDCLGSCRLGPDTLEYQWTKEVWRQLAEMGIATKTGYGTGIPEAPLLACIEAGRADLAIGICTDTDHEERPHPLVHALTHLFRTPEFSVRHDGLFLGSMFHMVLPGHLGTDDELIDLLNRQKHKHLPPAPVYLIERRQFYSATLDYLTAAAEPLGARILPEDLVNVVIIDIEKMTPTEFVNLLKEHLGWNEIAESQPEVFEPKAWDPHLAKKPGFGGRLMVDAMRELQSAAAEAVG